MKNNAPSQLLGYAIQIPRALYHLLLSSPGDTICVEVLGDVATIKKNSKVISEEDKTSTNKNPLFDKSEDLWKTFYNWIKAINDGYLSVEKTSFLLYCNKTGNKNSIVNQFHKVLNEQDAKKALKEVKEKFRNINNKHIIWKHYDYVINKNTSLLVKILPKFELVTSKGIGLDEVRTELKRMHFFEPQIEYIIEVFNGWLYSVIMEKISNNERANISWEIFHDKIKTIFDRARTRGLIDFALVDKQSIDTQVKKQMKKQIKESPYYIQQLDAINVSEDEIVEAVTDYLRAQVNRGKWIEGEIIDEIIASDFEKRLRDFWKNEKKRINIIESARPEEEKGMLVYLGCKLRLEKINDMTPPNGTISGTYHGLSNECLIGWHPQWEDRFVQKKGAKVGTTN